MWGRPMVVCTNGLGSLAMCVPHSRLYNLLIKISYFSVNLVIPCEKIMEGITVNITYLQSWNNLVDLPANLSSLLYNANVTPQEVIIEIVPQSGDTAYVGWSGMSSSSPKTISMDPIFAHSLKLADKQLVTVNVKINNVKTSTVYLEPEKFTDWELVELHANYIESKLIEQSRCVALDQILVVYPTKTSSVRLNVKSIGDIRHTYAILDPFAEISIAPKLKEKKRPSSRSVKSTKSGRSADEETSLGPVVIRRGVSLPNGLFKGVVASSNALEVYANTNEISHDFRRAEFVVVSVARGYSEYNVSSTHDNGVKRSVLSPKDQSKDFNSLAENPKIVANLVSSTSFPKFTLGLSQKLAAVLNVSGCVGYKVTIRYAGKSVSKRPATFVVHPYVNEGKSGNNLQLQSQMRAESQARFAQQLASVLFQNPLLISHFPITNNSKIPPISDVLPQGGIISFKRNDNPSAWIRPFHTGSEAKGLPKLEVGNELSGPPSSKFVAETLDSIYGSADKLDDIVRLLSCFENSSVMLYGASGSGKTLMMRWAERNLKHMFGFHVKFVSCESFMNDSFDQQSNQLSRWVNECLLHEPSVLILDDLDKILFAESEQGDSSTSSQLAELLCSILFKVRRQANTNVSLLVSGRSKESFNSMLTSSHLIERFVDLMPPGKDSRQEMLEHMLLERFQCSLEFDLMDIVLETEGFLPNDLSVLSERIYYELHNLRDDHTKIRSISRDAFKSAILGFRPHALRGVKLQSSNTGWSEIGGLTEAKNVLLETLEWPTRYAPIFASCPLRLRSGILLYGYPGCGKTLLASAIAAQSGLNFISIKGPEILNKYIGASEQSVRELFDRAQAAKPCILFFDEFDSIAPKRGHDSTGVTDRVVNQMLTQMDGAEGLDGVYVLAATSRPDLIDSALLRPGRLDKSIICNMPNFEDRLDILRRVCLNMNISPDVDLKEIARRTEGFSGADIQGLGYNAYLKAVHDKLAQQQLNSSQNTSVDENIEFFQVRSKFGDKVSAAGKISSLQKSVFSAQKKLEAQMKGCKNLKEGNQLIVITRMNFNASLSETKPSISASEMQKLSRVYSQFSTGRDGNMPDGLASTDIGGRTTLM